MHIEQDIVSGAEFDALQEHMLGVSRMFLAIERIAKQQPEDEVEGAAFWAICACLTQQDKHLLAVQECISAATKQFAANKGQSPTEPALQKAGAAS